MKIYLAGSSQRLPRVKEVMNFLELAGHTITHDWTKCFEERVKDYVQFARSDIAGIYSSEAVVFLFEEEKLPYQASFTELGLALAWRKKIFILGKGADKNIFSRLEDVTICYSLLDIFELLDEMEGGQND